MTFAPLADKSPELRNALTRREELLRMITSAKNEAIQLNQLISAGADPYASERISALVEGAQVNKRESLNSRLAHSRQEYSDGIEALRVVEQNITRETQRASRLVNDEVRPAHDKLLKRICSALTEAHSAFVDLYKLKNALNHAGVRVGSLFDHMPDFLGHPNNRFTDFAEFMRDCSREGFGKTPKELT